MSQLTPDNLLVNKVLLYNTLYQDTSSILLLWQYEGQLQCIQNLTDSVSSLYNHLAKFNLKTEKNACKISLLPGIVLWKAESNLSLSQLGSLQEIPANNKWNKMNKTNFSHLSFPKVKYMNFVSFIQNVQKQTLTLMHCFVVGKECLHNLHKPTIDMKFKPWPLLI